MNNNKPITALSFGFLTTYFDLLSKVFGYRRWLNNRVVELLKLKLYERVLDIGCGTANLLIAIKSKYPGIDTTGIDADEKILKIAGKKIKKAKLNIKLVKIGANKLPFPDSSFDVIVSTLVFHHLPTEIKKEAIKEIHRVLKRNGRFLLVDFGKFSGVYKFFYCLLVLFRIPEAITLKDNIEGKLPEYLRQANFKFMEVSEKTLGIQYLLAKKIN